MSKMPEKEIPLRQVGVSYVCDKCGKGEMVYKMLNVGIVLATSFEQEPCWIHVCNHCSSEAELKEKYPTVRWIREAE
jgi:DNA-directed RNA polymerase subunit RPC12/RpoP